MSLTLDRPAEVDAPLVEVKGLRHVYGGGKSGPGLVVLDDVNVTLRDHEIVGLLGRSGSGKSTLLRSIAGLITPSEGSVTINNPSTEAGQSAVAMVFQSFALFPWLTVEKNVELGLEAKGVPADQRRKRTLAAIDLIGLDGFENAYPKELSGGMRQRVGLARALVVEPAVLLMDEPFSALDVLTAETLRTDLVELWTEGRMPIRSILMVTHNIEEAVLMCDRVLVFSSNPGRVVAEVKVDLPRPRNRLAPDFRALVDDLYGRMTAQPKAAATQPGGRTGAPGLGAALAVLDTDTLASMIERLVTPPNDGEADLADLAGRLQMEADELLPIAETLQLMRFADMAGRTLRLTPAGRRYEAADLDRRKQIFAQHLLAYVPLARHIRRVLDEAPSHSAPASRFREELEESMSQAYAETTIEAITTWGRYAEIFAYHEDDDRFSLDDPA
ncbi:MAG: nitrate/sulfonate/bicarbonate ABC transporter ATP-binding protein [Alphaproteobacteria bacterium]|jgi:NitT/TauT family transport system ATP-binding protein|nr:nitrate/sulfonate/bicarbonate ABC transporter ATP-binding protein [Alphaproteobacteria bacterium]